MRVRILIHPGRLVASLMAMLLFCCALASPPAAHAGVFRHLVKPAAKATWWTGKAAAKAVWFVVR